MKNIITKVIVGIITLVLSVLCLEGIEHIYEEYVSAYWDTGVWMTIVVGVPWLMGKTSSYLGCKLTNKPEKIVVIRNASEDDVSKLEEVA